MKVSYIHGSEGWGNVPKGRPMMDRTRSEHKNDFNINITEQLRERVLSLSTDIGTNQNQNRKATD